MAENFIKLYSMGSKVESAFFLTEGTIYFYASNADKYAISGKNLIAGVTEIIMEHYAGVDTGRMETAVTDGSSIIKRMSAQKIIEGLRTYSVSLNISMVLAKQVLLSNKIINANLNLLDGDEKKSRDFSTEYYRLIERLRSEYEKRKLPWLKDILKKHEVNLTCKKGEAFCKSSEPVKITATKNLSDKSVEFERGEIICEQNSIGSEMFILESGTLDVLIDGNSVATIEDAGTVFGEMALLLGEKRTATLKAKNHVVVTRIRKEDLRDVADKQHEVLEGIAIALSRRHYYNIAKISNINRSLVEASLNKEAGSGKILQSEQARRDLGLLKKDLAKVIKDKKVDFLQDLQLNM